MTSSLERNSAPTLKGIVRDGVVDLLNGYIENPKDARWREMARNMDIEEGAHRHIAIVRYIIDMVEGNYLNTLQNNHWISLVTELGEEELQRVIREIFTSGHKGSEESIEAQSRILITLERTLVRYF